MAPPRSRARAQPSRAPLCAAAALVVAGLLAACGSGGSGGAPGGDESPAASPTPTAAVRTLSPDEAERLGAEAGTEATVVPASEPATPVAEPPVEAPAVTAAGDALAASVNAAAALPAVAEPDYDPYVVRTSGTFSFEAPADWSSVTTGLLAEGPFVIASSSSRLDVFHSNVVALRVAATTTVEDVLAERAAEYAPRCGGVGEVLPYDDGRLSGVSQTFTACEGSGNATVVAVTATEPSPFSGYLDVTLIDQRDTAALAHALRTLAWTD